MTIKEKTATGYVFQRDDGTTVTLSYMDVNCIEHLLDLENVKSDISDIVDDYDGEYISIGSLDMTREEFEQEVFDLLNDRMQDGYYNGDRPSYDTIEDVVMDTARDYGIEIDE